MFPEKFCEPSHNTVDRSVVHKDNNTVALVYSTDLTNIYYHPTSAHIRWKKNTAFDGHELPIIWWSTFQ